MLGHYTDERRTDKTFPTFNMMNVKGLIEWDIKGFVSFCTLVANQGFHPPKAQRSILSFVYRTEFPHVFCAELKDEVFRASASRRGEGLHLDLDIDTGR